MAHSTIHMTGLYVHLYWLRNRRRSVNILFFQKWIRIPSEFGLTYHPVQATVRQIHGAAAFVMMIIYGFLLASHVNYGWKQKRMRKLGISLIGLQLSLIITGYIIYYTKNESLQQLTATIHLLIGLLFPLMLIAHIASAIKARGTN